MRPARKVTTDANWAWWDSDSLAHEWVEPVRAGDYTISVRNGAWGDIDGTTITLDAWTLDVELTR
jgi:hypothetical protein